jgi:hypothetical protein
MSPKVKYLDFLENGCSGLKWITLIYGEHCIMASPGTQNVTFLVTGFTGQEFIVFQYSATATVYLATVGLVSNVI